MSSSPVHRAKPDHAAPPRKSSSVGAAPVGTVSAMFDGYSHLRLWTVTLIGLGVDLWSKHWAFAALGQGGQRSLIPHVLEFQTMLNDGALFGIGSGQTLFFIIASLLALGLVLWMFVQNPPQRWLLQLALGGILAGALGNMYDRVTVRLIPQRVATAQGATIRYFQAIDDDGKTMVVQQYPPALNAPKHQLSGSARAGAVHASGHVRDFIKINTTFRGKELWPWVFNVADIMLVVGVSILAIHLWTERRTPQRESSLTPSESAQPDVVTTANDPPAPTAQG